MEGIDVPAVITASVVACVLLDIYCALCFQPIARNLRVRPSWLVWVPVLNVHLWCSICGKGESSGPSSSSCPPWAS